MNTPEAPQESEAGTDRSSEEAIEFAHRLFDAARMGETDFVVTAIDQGVPVDLTDAAGNTLLMLSAYHGHETLVSALVSAGADVDRQNDRGQTPVAGAVFKRYDRVIQILIHAGADLEAGTPSARATAEMFGVTLS